jgi:hypothetical protein
MPTAHSLLPDRSVSYCPVPPLPYSLSPERFAKFRCGWGWEFEVGYLSSGVFPDGWGGVGNYVVW